MEQRNYNGPDFVDTHVHFWNLDHPTLTYSWLMPDVVHPVIGDIEVLKLRQWEAEHLKLEAKNAGVSKVVHVQAALGTADPVEETIWLDQAAQRTGWPNAIIAHTDLKGNDLEHQIERHTNASSRVRGVRDFSEGDYLTDLRFHRGCRVLQRERLLLELDSGVEDMDRTRALATRFPDLAILHWAGFPRDRTPDSFEYWRGSLRALASAENIWCKIAAVGVGDPTWTVHSIRPWVLECLEVFGVARCVMGTNWPVEKLFSSYNALVGAYRTIAGDLVNDEKAALLGHNAQRLFRI